MGATTFDTNAKGKDAKAAFLAAQQQARYDRGHSGYTGTIAEKSSFVMIPADPRTTDLEAARALVREMLNDGDPRIDDKWGPAGCIALKDGSFLFFGWASC